MARASEDVASIYVGVGAICSLGSPSPLAVTDDWTPVAAGGDTSSLPSLYAAVRDYGSGRVAAIGHRGVITNPDTLDNRRFSRQLMYWLAGDARRVGYYTGNRAYGSPIFAGPSLGLDAEGFQFIPVSTLSASALAAVDVMVILLPREPFAPQDVALLEAWVTEGGALCLEGLHWVWEGYEDPARLVEFPLNQLARPFGVSWLRGALQDNADTLNGWPVHRAFGPDAAPMRSDEALALIATIDDTLPPVAMQSILESAAGRDFVLAHHALAIDIEAGLEDSDAAVTELVRLVSVSPFYDMSFRSGPVGATAAWARAITWAAIAAGLRDESALGGLLLANGFSARHVAWVQDHGVFVLDDGGLDEPQELALDDLFDAVPPGLPLPAYVTVNDFLGTPSVPINRVQFGSRVNIFGVRTDQAPENQFPSDADPVVVPVFAATAAHEVMHVIDAEHVLTNDALSAHRAQLLAQAGNEPMQYLRSMFAPGFFPNAPQEFVASMANEWYADSARVFELGTTRADAGWLGPMNQAAFMARIHRVGDAVRCMRMDHAGRIAWHDTTASFRPDGRLAEILLDGVRYSFVYDASGLIVGATRSCPADLTADGTLNLDDIAAFADAFIVGDLLADLDDNATLNFDDITLFATAFTAGCP